MSTDYSKNIFRWLHIAWAIIGVSACAVLATSGGHPPGIVLVPIVAAIWLVGHGVLWVSRKLAIRGENSAPNSNTVTGKWPLVLILLVFLFGMVFIFGLFGIVWQILFESNWLRESPLPLAIWVPSSFCFIGILLRQDWSRMLAGSGFILVALILLYEMIASFMRGYRNSNTEWLIVIVLFILLVLFGQHILRSPRIKSFYSIT